MGIEGRLQTREQRIRIVPCRRYRVHRPDTEAVRQISARVERLDESVMAREGTLVRTWNVAPDGLDVAQLRAWIRMGRKLAIAYSDETDRATERTVWPLLIGYRDATRLLVAWCELRTDFRTFRLDRIKSAEFIDVPIPQRPALLRAQYLKRLDRCD